MSKMNLNEQNIFFCDQDFSSQNDVFNLIGKEIFQRREISDSQIIVESLTKREAISTTAFGNGIAIPHARILGLTQPEIIFLRLKNPVPWNAWDQESVNLVFCLLIPENLGDLHLEILSNLASLLLNEEVLKILKSTPDKKEVRDLLNFDSSTLDEEKIKNLETQQDQSQPYVLAVSACTFGLAHTYLVEQKFLQYAQKHNIAIKVETHGAKGEMNVITPEDLKKAQGVIVAVDKDLDLSHLKHQNIVYFRTFDVMKNVDQVFNALKNQQKQNIFYQFFRLKLFGKTNKTSSFVFNYLMVLGIIIGLSNYVLSFGSNYFFESLITGTQYLAILVPPLLLGVIIYYFTKKNQIFTGAIFTISAVVTEYYFIQNEATSFGVLGALVYGTIVCSLYYFLTKGNTWIYTKINQKTKNKVSLLLADNLFSGIKFLIKFLIPLAIGAVIFYTFKYSNFVNREFFNLITNQNQNWWFVGLIAFVFILGMNLDCGGPINKWTLVLSGVLFYDSFAHDVNNIWMTPITATSLAIVMPVGAAWFRGILIYRYVDENEKIAIKNIGVSMLKGMTEAFLFFKEHYGWKAIFANVLTAILMGVMIGIFNLKFYGGINNIFGVLFSFSTTNFIKIPNLGFGIISVTGILGGGLIHLICYPPLRKREKNGKKEMKDLLYSSNSLG